MKISESQLREQVRKILLTECCCQKKQMLNEIERGSSLAITYREWVPGTCEIDFSKIPGFEKIFLGKNKSTDVDSAVKQISQDSTLAKFLPNTAAELNALRAVIGKVINNVDLALNVMGVPAIACYWIQRAIDLFAEVIGIGSAYVSRGTTKKSAAEIEKKDGTGLVSSIVNSVASKKGKEGVTDVVIDLAKKAPVPKVKAIATAADVVTERKLIEQDLKSVVSLPAGFSNVFPEATLSGLDMDALDRDIENYLKVTRFLSEMESEDSQVAYKQIAALNDIQVDSKLMRSLPSEEAYDVVEELKEKAIAGRKIAIAELLPLIAKALVDTEVESQVMDKMRDFISKLQAY